MYKDLYIFLNFLNAINQLNQLLLLYHHWDHHFLFNYKFKYKIYKHNVGIAILVNLLFSITVNWNFLLNVSSSLYVSFTFLYSSFYLSLPILLTNKLSLVISIASINLLTFLSLHKSTTPIDPSFANSPNASWTYFINGYK